MASTSTNATISALRARHAAQDEAHRAQLRAETAAARLVADAITGLDGARERRAAAMGRLDAEMAAARRGHDIAVSVLAVILGDEDAAAGIAGVDVAAVRAARRRALRDEVDAAVSAVRSAAPRPRRTARDRVPIDARSAVGGSSIAEAVAVNATG